MHTRHEPGMHRCAGPTEEDVLSWVRHRSGIGNLAFTGFYKNVCGMCAGNGQTINYSRAAPADVSRVHTPAVAFGPSTRAATLPPAASRHSRVSFADNYEAVVARPGLASRHGRTHTTPIELFSRHRRTLHSSPRAVGPVRELDRADAGGAWC